MQLSQCTDSLESDPSKGLQPLTIRQLLNAVPIQKSTADGEATVFVLDGRPVRQCVLVANIYMSNKTSRGVNYGLDDSTGRITGTDPTFEDPIPSEYFAYARVIGTLRRWNGINRLDISHIRPVINFYEVYHHVLSCIFEFRELLPDHIKSMKVSPKVLPSSIDSIANAMADATLSHVDDDHSVKPDPDSSIAKAESPKEQESSEGPTLVYDSLTIEIARKLRKKILRFILQRQRIDGADDHSNFNGVPIEDIVAAMRERSIGDPLQAMTSLFNQQQKLFNKGARNFLFIDVPPIHLTPAVPNRPSAMNSCLNRVNSWNAALRDALHDFCSSHEDALFSANRVFNNLLDNPDKFGFAAEPEQSDIWVDHIHPTSKVHDVVARSIGEFLNGIAPGEAECK
ncbi:hypothetical protein CVT24_007751 [Panaeolus cyanescens]|uniref:Uncharacterized protein n=1 Tax=Panaeolus cyanescens TaxID=181874 RepID=A0A409YKT2_9AGAR|nr:hypothetical protein CVT24_007751 [Panaeolus cyanescens]